MDKKKIAMVVGGLVLVAVIVGLAVSYQSALRGSAMRAETLGKSAA